MVYNKFVENGEVNTEQINKLEADGRILGRKDGGIYGRGMEKGKKHGKKPVSKNSEWEITRKQEKWEL